MKMNETLIHKQSLCKERDFGRNLKYTLTLFMPKIG